MGASCCSSIHLPIASTTSATRLDCSYCSVLALRFGSGPRCFHAGVRVTSSCPTPGARGSGLHRPCASCPGLELLLVAHVPVSSCTVPRRHGRTNHEPEDVPQGGFGQDLPHYPPMSHGSSRFEVDEKALRKRVSLRPLCGPPTHRVAAVVFLTTCVLCSTLCSTPCRALNVS